jgi:sugar lactone lactonase YvrE
VGADVSAVEAAQNPDAGDPGSGYDSNPYAVADAGHGAVVVADAGGNDLIGVDARGRANVLAVFHATLVAAPPFLGLPPGTTIPMQAVPNSVTRGPDGAWYVGTLTGFPFPAGAAQVWRVTPGHAPTVVASGFTNIIDLAFDRRGRLLVLEIAKNGLLDPTSPGALWRVDRVGAKTLVTDALTAPGGVVVGTDGRAYVTNASTSPGAGQVLRIPLPD